MQWLLRRVRGFDLQSRNVAGPIAILVAGDGDGDLLTSRMKNKATDRTYALYLAGIFDDYNNGEVCNGDPSH